MRVLLAGASGAIGTHLIPELIASGHEVIGITRKAGSLEGTGATELVADVSRRSKFLAALEGVEADGVINQLTALSQPPLSFRHMRVTNRLRSEGTSTLMAAARRIGARRFVTASVVYGYGFGDAGDEQLDETAPFAQLDGTRNNRVLAALLTNEQQVRAFGGVALRYGLFYAPGAKDISPVPRHWNGLLPVIHLHDAARATVLALERGRLGEAYNIVDDEPVTWRELQEMQARADGFSPPIVVPESVLRRVAPFGAQLMTTMSLRLSNSKAKRELKWKLQYPSLREGLRPAPAAAGDTATVDTAAGNSGGAGARSPKVLLQEAPAAMLRAAKAFPQRKPADEAVEPAGPGEKLRSMNASLRAKLEAQAVARAERKAVRDAERAVERAAALERAEQEAIRAALAAELAAERAAERAAEQAAEQAARKAAALAATAAADDESEAQKDSVDEQTADAEADPDDDSELGTYADSGSHIDTYFEPEPEPEPEPESEPADADADKELDQARNESSR